MNQELHSGDGGGNGNRELAGIEKHIGELLQASRNAESQRTTIFEKIDALRKEVQESGEELLKLRIDHDRLVKEVNDDIKPAVGEFKKLKQRGIGIMAGVVLATGSVTAWITKVLHLPRDQ